MNKCKKNLTV